jgi:hypothetical protein
MFLAACICLPGFISCGDKAENENPYDKPHNPRNAIVVNDIGPESGGIGTKVVVAGSNFGNDPSKVELYFNSKKAFVMKVQDNAIYALTPKQPGDFSTIKVVIGDKDAVLEGKQFRYFTRASVTTVAGKVGVSAYADGPALEATFVRTAMVAVDKDNQIIFVSDDQGSNRIRMISLQDNKVTTVIDGMNSPWQSAFNLSSDKFFVVERAASTKPLLFYALYKKSNWLERDPFYDQTDAAGNYIGGSRAFYGLAADDEYVYLLATSGQKFLRIHQESRKVELIGENLGMESWTHIAFNPKDRLIYASAESWGRVYRLDPYHTPPGRTTPWITPDDIEYIVGGARGAAKEGNGKNAQMGSLEGICADVDGNVYVTDYQNHIIWKIDPGLNATIVAGTPGSAGYIDGVPKESKFQTPFGITVTADGILYVGDTNNRLVRCISIQ